MELKGNKNMKYFKLNEEQIKEMIKTNKNAMKWLNGEEVKTIEERYNKFNNKLSYIINGKIEIYYSETLGSKRRYYKLFVYKL